MIEEDEPDVAAETELPAAVKEPDARAEGPDQGETDQARVRLVSRPHRSELSPAGDVRGRS
jgi:hypothetical protein